MGLENMLQPSMLGGDVIFFKLLCPLVLKEIECITADSTHFIHRQGGW